jgi:CheY-like chemotaxis protein
VAKQHLLLVDADTKGLRLMEVSLKKANFSVTTASHGRDALEKVQISPPDLVVSDTKMPEMDGFELCRSLKADERFKHIPFVFLTGQKGVELKVKGLELGAEDYLTRPIYIKEVVARLRMILQKAEKDRLERRETKGGFAGNLADMGLVDLVQTFEMGRKTGTLSVKGDRTGNIYFRDGRVVDAETGKLVGDNAFYRLLNASEGSFDIQFAPVERPERIEVSTQGLLMEGMRRIDEWGRMLEQLPPLETVFDIDYAALADRLSEIPDEVNGLLRLFDGHRSLHKVVDDSDFEELNAVGIISKLYFEGLLKETAAPPSDAGAPRPKMDEWLNGEQTKTPALGLVAITPPPAPPVPLPAPAAAGPSDDDEHTPPIPIRIEASEVLKPVRAAVAAAEPELPPLDAPVEPIKPRIELANVIRFEPRPKPAFGMENPPAPANARMQGLGFGDEEGGAGPGWAPSWSAASRSAPVIPLPPLAKTPVFGGAATEPSPLNPVPAKFEQGKTPPMGTPAPFGVDDEAEDVTGHIPANALLEGANDGGAEPLPPMEFTPTVAPVANPVPIATPLLALPMSIPSGPPATPTPAPAPIELVPLAPTPAPVPPPPAPVAPAPVYSAPRELAPPAPAPVPRPAPPLAAAPAPVPPAPLPPAPVAPAPVTLAPAPVPVAPAPPPVQIAPPVYVQHAMPAPAQMHVAPMMPMQPMVMAAPRSRGMLLGIVIGVLIAVLLVGGAVVGGMIVTRKLGGVTPTQQPVAVTTQAPAVQQPVAPQPVAQTVKPPEPTPTPAKPPEPTPVATKPPEPRPEASPEDSEKKFATYLAEAQKANRSDQFKKAASSFRKALAIKPDSMDAKAGLGIALVNSTSSASGYAEAAKLLEQVVVANENDERSWLALGMAYQFGGRKGDAVVAFKKYLVLAPNGESAADVKALLEELDK